MTEPADRETIERDIASFEEEKTSPELRARFQQHAVDDSQRPIAVVGILEARRRERVIGLLRADGWNALEAHDAEEILELSLSVAPFLVLVDADIRGMRDQSVPELLRLQRPDAALRTVAMVGGANQAERIVRALADGFDDFVTEVDNDLMLVARVTANLRAARTLAQLNRQKRDAALLLKLTQTLGSSLDMQLILHSVSRLVAEVLTLERCSIILLHPDDDDAMMVAASEDRTVRDLRIQLSKYPEVKSCAETGSPVIISDVSADPLLSPMSQNLLGLGVRNMALFPIVFEGHVTGVLFLRSSKPSRMLTDHEVQFGQTVAAACAVAIRNARLFDQFRNQHVHLQTMQEQAVRQTEALRKYQDFFEYAADGISVIDVDGRVHYVNKEGRRLLGRTRDELKSINFQSLLVADSARRWGEVVDQVRHGRFQRSFDVYVNVADEERVFSLSAGGVGQGTGLLILSFRDVTEMREMEGELRTTKEFLENLINSSVDAIVAADMTGKVMLFNKGAEKMYGYRAVDIIGRMHVTQLYPGQGASEIMNRLRDGRYGGQGRLAPERREILTAGGDVVPVSMSASIIYEDGEEVATVGVFTDLRDRMAIERQLNEARDQLTKAEKARVAAELAGMAAHELNQPLTSVLGYAEMLKARIPESDTKLRRHVEIIFTQAERMAEIVRKIGRVTKYEIKRYGGQTDMIDLNRAIEGAEAMADGDRQFRPSFGGTGWSQPPTAGAGALLAEDDAGGAPPPTNAMGDGSAPRSAGVMAALLSRSEPSLSLNSDPRSAVVRMDTVDEDQPGYAGRLKSSPERPPARVEATPSSTTGSFRMPLRSVHMDNVPTASDQENEHTNPGVRVRDLRNRTPSDT